MKISRVEVGPSMALALDAETSRAYAIGINATGELGVGDKNVRKTFVKVDELGDKTIEEVSVGKNSGFVVAIGAIQFLN